MYCVLKMCHQALGCKFYGVVVRPAMLHRSECWRLVGPELSRLEDKVAEMRMLK